MNPEVPKVTETNDAVVNTSSKSSSSDSARMGERDPAVRLLTRYRDAYRVARFIVGFGTALKVVGVLLGILVFYILVSIRIRGYLPYGMSSIGGFLFGILIWFPFFVVGVMVSAQGQILKATVDSAVNNSPLLTNEHRVSIMSL
jgi:hypothetical protein